MKMSSVNASVGKGLGVEILGTFMIECGTAVTVLRVSQQGGVFFAAIPGFQAWGLTIIGSCVEMEKQTWFQTKASHELAHPLLT